MSTPPYEPRLGRHLTKLNPEIVELIDQGLADAALQMQINAIAAVVMQLEAEVATLHAANVTLRKAIARR